MSPAQEMRERPHLATFVGLRDSHISALLRRSGYDAVVIDTEHFALNPETVTNHIIAARAAGLTSLVRVAEASRSAIQRALDSGPDGILVPLVNDADQARRVVEFSRYAPLGSRGFHGLTPATGWGRRSGREHVRAANAEILVAVQIETPAAVEACEAIAAVPGIDMLFLGPGDLSHSMGITGEYDDERLLAGLRRGLEIARSAGRLSGIYAARPHLETLAREHGAGLILRGSDARFLLDGAAAAADVQ